MKSINQHTKDFFEAFTYGVKNSSDVQFEKMARGEKEAIIVGFNPWSINWMQYWIKRGIPIKGIVNLENKYNVPGINPNVFVNFDDLSPDKHIGIVCVAWNEAKEVEDMLLRRNISYVGWENVDGSRYMPHFETNIIYKNLDKIYFAYSLLCDDDSREVFLSLLRYRLTHNVTEVVQSNYPEYFHPIVRMKQNDTIIEAGGFTGDTALQLVRSLPIGGGVKYILLNPIQKTLKN